MTVQQRSHHVESIMTRRSVSVLGDAGPTAEEIDVILQAAATVPDHGGLRPWRFVVVEGDARSAFGDALADAGREANPELRPEVADRLRGKAFVAPALIAVAAHLSPEGKIPEWEQVASASCAGYAMTLAAHALGLGAMWKSSPFHDGAALRRVLDLEPFDQFLGWVNLGRLPQGAPTQPRPPVDLAPIARVLTVDGSSIGYTAP